MNMAWYDWLILGTLLAVLLTVLAGCKKFVRSSADFLAASRLGGRYLLTISAGLSGIGAVTIIAAFEMNYNAGFSPVWWGFVTGVIGIVSALSGTNSPSGTNSSSSQDWAGRCSGSPSESRWRFSNTPE